MSPDTRRPHPRISSALRELAETDLSQVCAGQAPPLLLRGIDEFNRGQFFEQHETLEELWRAEGGPVRYLYQGVLQIGVGFLHLKARNLHGAAVKLENGLALLEPFEPHCLGVDVGRLRHDALKWLDRIRTGKLDGPTLPRIRMLRSRHGTGHQ